MVNVGDIIYRQRKGLIKYDIGRLSLIRVT